MFFQQTLGLLELMMLVHKQFRGMCWPLHNERPIKKLRRFSQKVSQIIQEKIKEKKMHNNLIEISAPVIALVYLESIW